MTRTTAQEKGDALENAVRMIETVILGADPYAIDSPIKIERKKIIKVQGVRHEIDIYITANIGKGYTSTFIFECKNWVELLEADDAINVFHPFLDGLPFLNHSFLETEVKIRVMTPGPDNEDFLWGFQRESFVKYMSEDLLLRDLVEGIRWGIASEEVSKLSSQEIAAFGKEPRYYEKTRIFGYQSGELFVEGTECSAIEIRLKWGVKLTHPTIVSTFDIKTRGRVFTVETDQYSRYGGIQFSLIATDEGDLTAIGELP